MMADIYRLIEKWAGTDPGLDSWEGLLDGYTKMYDKWRGHPMIRILGPAATEYLEKRWDHMSGRC